MIIIMRLLAMFFFAIAGLSQLMANSPFDIENRLHHLDSITSSRLLLAEQSAFLVDPPFELTTYFQIIDQTCPKLLDSISFYAKSIADYSLNHPDTFSDALLSFQDVDSYVSTVSYTIKKCNPVQWPLKRYLLKAFCPNDNYKLLLRKNENRNKLNDKLKVLLDTLIMQSRITLVEKNIILNECLQNSRFDYSKRSLTQEDLIWLSVGDTIVQKVQLPEEQLHYNLFHNGAMSKYSIYCSRNNNDIHMTVETYGCRETQDSLYNNDWCFDLTDYQLLDYLIGVLYNELITITIDKTMNLTLDLPQSFCVNELLKTRFSLNGVKVNKVIIEKECKTIKAKITTQFKAKAANSKKIIFSMQNENDVI